MNLKEIKRHKDIYILMFIPIIYFIIFKYVPMLNGQIAFKDFKPRLGVWGSPWAGLRFFKEFFSSYYFWELIRNTVGYSFGKLILSVPLSIILAVVLFESHRETLRKIVQTLTYLPHFLSWVIMYGILLSLLAPGDGVINDLVKMCGGEPIDFLTNTKCFPWIVLFSDAWKEMGWGAIIFIAALMGIDPSLYEAAMVEGTTALQRTWYITIPSIRPVIVMVVLLKLGTILNAGFNQIFMLYNTSVLSVADIIDTWVYRQGLLDARFSLATAVGIFKGIIGTLLVAFANRLTKVVADSSLF
ncbi:MAG: ABC transporter permease subunit [Treponema sp.]|nr:ABC transporter permease subunit [Spirochaetia bacterium]MDD6295340.1 ABC transporter permease subunit [Treponema sp.]MDD7450332.1 ABC transporter permease subunit [Treponema sp.]MDY2923604.1 ABC transporter permease subunit [Treponema sp.]MDY5682386.1 ABC transporter permease subunit [Treponema sp.]